MKRIHEFEALRGFLALWVLVGHVIKLCGYGQGLGLLGDPGLPVDVFIILSGFVIFSLIDHKHEGYVPFIVRRFFRLYPVYVVVLLAGALLANEMLVWTINFPWKTPFLQGGAGIVTSSRDFLPLHILAHLTMLHGLVSGSVLPFSQYAIIGQAWSISVEWQFYLVAPLLFYLLRRSPAILSLLVIGLMALHTRYWLGEGFALWQGQYFLLGIACYFAYKHSAALRLDGPHLLLAAVLGIATAAWFTLRPISLALWIVVFTAAIHAKQGGINPISTISQWRLPQLFGRISYSVYLWHVLVLMLISIAVLDAMPDIGKSGHVAIVMTGTLVLTPILSLLSFRFIEQPGMNLGQRLAKRLRPKPLQPAINAA